MTKQTVTSVTYSCDLCEAMNIEPFVSTHYLHNYVQDGLNMVEVRLKPKLYYISEPHLCKPCAARILRRVAEDLERPIENEET